MAIDGAQFLRIGRDVIVNVTTYNHYLGYEWVKSLFPESEFHMISVADNHIDGELSSSGCISPESGICLDKGCITGEVPQLGFYLSRRAD